MSELRGWFEGERYLRQFELTFRDCDAQGRIRPATILSLMGIVAGQDYDERGLTYEQLYAIRQVFLLSRAAFRLTRYPGAGETVTVSTWENGVRGAHMRRSYEMAGADGGIFAACKSDWILVDPVDRRILRPSAFTGKPLGEGGGAIDCPDCVKVAPPAAEMEELAARTVRFSDLDHNGHLYSGNYGDIVWDYLPRELQDAAVREFQINYSREATLGEEMRLLGRRDGALYEMEGLCGGERCFTCACRF